MAAEVATNIIYEITKSSKNIITTLTADLFSLVFLHMRSMRGRDITAIKSDMPKGIKIGKAYLKKINKRAETTTILAPTYAILRYFSIKSPLLLLFCLNIDFSIFLC